MPTSTNTLVAVGGTLLAISVIAVSLRLFVRIKLIRSLGIDDKLMVLSLGIYIVFTAFLFVAVHYGLGQHPADLTVDHLVMALKYIRFVELSYIAVAFFAKLSIAYLLLRLVVEARQKFFIYGIAFVSTVFCAVGFFYAVFECSPIKAAWDVRIKNASCVKLSTVQTMGYVFSAVIIAVDWSFALVPVWILWNVRMSLRMKLSVICLLGLGVFSSISPLVKLKYITSISHRTDFLFIDTDILLWTAVEIGMGITASCISTYRPLFRFLHIDGFSSATNAASSNHPASRSHTQELTPWNESHRTYITRTHVDDVRDSTESIIPKGGSIIHTINSKTSEGMIIAPDHDLEAASHPHGG